MRSSCSFPNAGESNYIARCPPIVHIIKTLAVPSAQASYVTKHLGFSCADVFRVELLYGCAMLGVWGQQYHVGFDTSCVT